MKSRPLIAVTAAALLVPAVAAGVLIAAHQRSSEPAARPPPSPYRGSQPPKGIRVPDIALRSYRGPLVRLRALRGKVVAVTFLDTACRDKCPIIAAAIGAGMRLLRPTERSEVDALAISVLPPTDTPPHVRRFLKQRRALGELDWLIGPLPELLKTWKRFAVFSALQSGKANAHSADVRIFDAAGIWVSTLHTGVDLTPANLAHDIRVALAERR
jgi:protein SCO1/2